MDAPSPAEEAPPSGAADGSVCLFLSGDVMTGRGVDQILAHPGDPQLYEPWVDSALEYVELAERTSGPIGRGLDPAYPWGDALAMLARHRPDRRIINLETAVTDRGQPWPDKGIHYRMHPANLGCLAAARIDCCVLANNHVLDWGADGLLDTLTHLQLAGLQTVGAGRNAREAAQAAQLPLAGGGCVKVWACATPDSGVAPDWAATATRCGVQLLESLSPASAGAVAQRILRERQPGDLAVVSIHWGGNWGFGVDSAQRAFAHRLVDAGAADIVHGHSSHHVRGVEIYRERLLLYGCGDLLNDYEGISGHEEYGPGLSLMYFPRLDRRTGQLCELVCEPMRTRRLRLERASRGDAQWLHRILCTEGRPLGTSARLQADGSITLIG